MSRALLALLFVLWLSLTATTAVTLQGELIYVRKEGHDLVMHLRAPGAADDVALPGQPGRWRLFPVALPDGQHAAMVVFSLQALPELCVVALPAPGEADSHPVAATTATGAPAPAQAEPREPGIDPQR